MQPLPLDLPSGHPSPGMNLPEVPGRSFLDIHPALSTTTLPKLCLSQRSGISPMVSSQGEKLKVTLWSLCQRSCSLRDSVLHGQLHP